VADQRMDTAIVYWEGLVGVFDQSGKRIGKGYMELTGYGT
jgi:predicted secreted hydrolase